MLMHNVNQLLAKSDDKIIDKCHIVELALLSRDMTNAVFSAIHKILGSQRIPIFLGKQIKRS
ncbi:hypothetical protein D3C76_1640230 [compost metagenome]